MGRRGPKPAPVEEKIAKGTYRPDRDGSLVLMGDRATLGNLTAPEHLTPEQRDAWDEVVTPMIASGALDTADRLALEQLAMHVATWRAAETQLRAELARDPGAYVVEGSHGAKMNPMLDVRAKAMKDALAIMSRFGMTPSDRVAIGLGVVKGASMQQAMAGSIGESPRRRGRPARAAASDGGGE